MSDDLVATEQPQSKGKGGRPTLYREEYCDFVIELGKQGASQKEMALRMSIPSSTFHKWLNAHPEFREAVDVANDYAQGWWEQAGRLATFGHGVMIEGLRPLTPANATMYIFNMKNRFRRDWSDMSTVDHRSSDGSMSPRRIVLEPGGPEIDTEAPSEPESADA